jgi:hypothetical protein
MLNKCMPFCSRGAGTAQEFALYLVKYLKGEDVLKTVAAGMVAVI